MKKLIVIMAAVIMLVIVTLIIGMISISDTKETIRQADAFVEMVEGGK